MKVLFALFPLLLLAACGSSDEVVEPASAATHYAQGMEYFEDEDFLEAIQEFEIIRLQYPTSPLADSARFMTGRSRYEREEYILASYEFKRLIQNTVHPELVPESYYMFAQSYYQLSPRVQLDQSYTTVAIDALQNFLEMYPGHEMAPECERQLLELVNKIAEKEYLTGVLYTKMENIRSAMVYFNTVTDRYYNTEFADDAAIAKIRIHMEREDFGEAWKGIAEFIERHPDSVYHSEAVEYREELEEILPPGWSSKRGGGNVH